MGIIDVCLLGVGGMAPLPGRWLSSMALRYEGSIILVDCGEGTQIPLKMSGWGFKAIDSIFLTHCHADHVTGLPGLLLTVGNSGKSSPMDIYGPPGSRRIVEALLAVCPELPFDVRAAELPLIGDVAKLAAEPPRLGGGFPLTGDMRYGYVPADHRTPCVSYRFSLRRRAAFFPDKAKALDVPVRFWRRLQMGERVTTDDGRTIEPGMVTGDERRGLSVGFCTDTRPTAAMPAFFADVDLLVCEGLYGDDAQSQNAAKKKHMVFSEAAKIARDARAGELWLTHYSPAMPNPRDYVANAKALFRNAKCGRDLMTAELKFRD